MNTDEEFAELERALDQISVHGHRGFVEQQGSSMKNWKSMCHDTIEKVK